MSVVYKCCGVIAIVCAWVLIGWVMPIVQLSENQALYVFSSQAQIVAAIYGLTITGYIFLHGQQERLADRDKTLIDTLNDIKVSQHAFITFLTLVSLSAIFFALFAIVFRESSNALLKVVIQNSAAAMFFIALICTGHFVREAMRPNKIEEASEKIKKTIEKRKAQPVTPDQLSRGRFDSDNGVSNAQVNNGGSRSLNNPSTKKASSFEEFLAYYNKIERSLDVFTDQYLARAKLDKSDLSRFPSYDENKEKRRSAWSRSEVVRIMRVQGFINQKFADELSELIRYRNALVHGRDFTVSSEIIALAKITVVELDRILGKIFA